MKFLLVALALCQSPPTTADPPKPDSHGEVMLKVPAYQGETARAPIPASMHIKNEGGSDGQGLCVIASGVINGHYQNVGDLVQGKGSLLWRTAKSRRGGYAPEKLKSLLNEVMPNEKFATYYGSDERVLEQLSSQGYPIAVTMGTGALYHYRSIAHMVCLVSYKTDGWACVVDNNNPGVYSWMPAKEFVRRWKDSSGDGWGWVWTKRPPHVPNAPLLPKIPGLPNFPGLPAMPVIKRALGVPELPDAGLLYGGVGLAVAYFLFSPRSRR